MIQLSIITPVYNGEAFIRESIESISQLAVQHEHIVVDGGSTDGTLAILSEYPHLTLIHQTEKNGMYEAIDMGFRAAKGKYIAWINCDDRILPEAYAQMVRFAQAGAFDFVCSDGHFVYVNDNERCKRERGTRFAKHFLRHGVFPFIQPSVLYTRDLYFAIGGLNYHTYKLAGDFDLFYRFAKVPAARFGYIPIVTNRFLKHGNSLSDNYVVQARTEKRTILADVRFRGISKQLFQLCKIVHL